MPDEPSKHGAYPSADQALDAFFAAWDPMPIEEVVPLGGALGRACSRDLFSRNTLPAVRASAKDGIAVKSRAFAGSNPPDASAWAEGVDYVRADTGDDFDDAFDAVVLIEDVELLAGGGLAFAEGVAASMREGLNVRPSGSLIARGDAILAAGTVIRPMDLASLALGGIVAVPVRKRPRIAFIPTGSELVEAGMRPARGQNVNANSAMVAAMLEEFGAEPFAYPIVKDDPALIGEALDEALSFCDAVVLNAGTSKGSEDFSFRSLGERSRLICHRIAAAPGVPMALAVVDGKPVVNLAGPPAAAFFGASWCLEPLVRRLLGLPPRLRRRVDAILAQDLPCPSGFEFLRRLDVVRTESGTFEARPVAPGDGIAAALSANAQYVSPIGEGLLHAGQTVSIELLRAEEPPLKRGTALPGPPL